MDSNVVSLSGGAGAVSVPVAPPAVPAAKPPPPEVEPPRPAPDVSFLAKAGGAAGDVPGGLRDTYARFVVDPETYDVHVEIVDASKHQVIRTIPGDDLRRIAQDYRATNGYVLDSTA